MDIENYTDIREEVLNVTFYLTQAMLNDNKEEIVIYRNQLDFLIKKILG